MDIIVFEPYTKQYLKSINGSIASMELIVGGEIEINGLKENYVLVSNRRGILLRLRQNNHKPNIVGTFFIAKTQGENIIGLETAEVKRFTSNRFVFNKNLIG